MSQRVERAWRQGTATPPSTPSPLTIATYNVLAECYTFDNFTYCAPEYLAWCYRFDLIVSDILEANPDVVCLQEVEDGCYVAQFVPVLQSAGYMGAFHKDPSKPAGCAVFYKHPRFQAVETLRVSISELARDPGLTVHLRGTPPRLPRVSAETAASYSDPHALIASSSWTRSQIAQHNKLWSWLEEMPHPVVVVVLVDTFATAPCHLVIGDAHLYWNPKYPEIKALQAALIVELLDRARLRTNGGDCAVVLAGDLNSMPEIRASTEHDTLHGDAPLVSGVYQMLKSGCLLQSHPHHPRPRRTTPGAAAAAQRRGAPPPIHAQSVPDIVLPLKFESAYASVLGGREPSWTNWHTHDFKETLDFIFIATHSRSREASSPSSTEPPPLVPLSTRCWARAVLDVPSDSAVLAAEGGEAGGCPNSLIPSDHILLLCELAVL